MPRYVFKCVACQKTNEPFYPIEQGPPPAVICEHCGREAFRVFDAAPGHFKGGGWGGK